MSAVDFILTFFLGTSWCHFISSLQDLWFHSFYSLTLSSYNMTQYPPLLKQIGMHWAKHNRSLPVFNVLIQYLWGYQPAYLSVSPQKFLKELSSFPSLYIHSILKELVKCQNKFSSPKSKGYFLVAFDRIDHLF